MQVPSLLNTLCLEFFGRKSVTVRVYLKLMKKLSQSST